MDIQEQQDRSPLTLFYSYADQDERLCEELKKHLSILQRQCKSAHFVGGNLHIAWEMGYTGEENRAAGFFPMGERRSWWNHLSL